MSKIRWSPSASITPMAQAVVLRSDLGSFQLDGPDVSVFVSQLVPLLDGTRDLDEVAGALPGYSPASVHSLLELLHHKGLVERVEEVAAGADVRAAGASAAQERFFLGVGVSAAETCERLRRARVLLAGLEPWGAVTACELAAAGIGTLHLLDDAAVEPDDLLAVRWLRPSHLGRLRRDAVREVLGEVAPGCAVSVQGLECLDAAARPPADGPWDLVITGLTADDLFWLRRVADFAHRAGVRSLYGHLDGFEAWIGPAVVPGETACWNCFRLRRLGAADHPTVAHQVDTSLAAAPAARRARSYLAPMAPVAGHLVAIEALKLLSAFTPSRLQGRFIVHNLISAECTHHGVIRMPWCEVCGPATPSLPRPGGAVAPADSSSRGHHRPADNLRDAKSVEELDGLLEGWVDPRTGIIRAVARGQTHPADPDSLELPLTATAILAAYTEGQLRTIADPAVASGKGLTAVEALLGATGEAIERYSAARYRKDDLRLATFRELGEAAFDPRHLCLYEESQYDEPGFPYARFDPDRPIHWVKGFWIDSREPVWVPALTVFFNFEASREELFCQVSSNGLAAGADLDDAAVRALFELVERDAFMLSWLCQLPGRPLRVEGGLDAGTSEVVRQLGEHGAAVELYLLDVGLGIPTVVCLGLGDGERWPAATVALATHVDPRVAARKSVLEQGHVGPYVVRLMRSGGRVPATPAEVMNLDDHALYYVPAERRPLLDPLRLGGGEPLPLADLPVAAAPTLAGCAERLGAAGVRVAIVDVTAPDVALGPFRVARAIGTDMQPIHFGERLRRLANPRLKALLGARGINPQPHPVA